MGWRRNPRGPGPSRTIPSSTVTWPPGCATAAAQLAGANLVLVLGAPVFAFLPYEPAEARLPPGVQITDDADEAARAPTVLGLVATCAPSPRT